MGTVLMPMQQHRKQKAAEQWDPAGAFWEMEGLLLSSAKPR